MKKFLVSVFILFNFLVLNVYADSYYVDGTYVKMRKEPNTNCDVLTVFNNGDALIMNNYNAAATTDTSKCAQGWANVTYNNMTGYICKDYVKVIVENQTADDPNYASQLRNAGFAESYIPYLTYLHQIHPNWQFVAKRTNTNFNDAVSSESACNSNLVPSTDDSKYRNLNCPNQYHGWSTASSQTIAYYMDPRNFLNEQNIFMFEYQYVNNNISTDAYRNAVANIFSGKFIYEQIPDLPTFIAEARDTEVSPIAIASRIKQEMGDGKLGAGTTYAGQLYSAISGNYYDRFGELNGLNLNHYYNFYNYGAADSCSGITQCALLYAYRVGWGGTGNQYNDRMTAIKGGARRIKTNFLDKGQFTAYFQKFNVAPNSASSRYINQYMTNVRAPYSEGLIIYQAYKSLSMLDSSFAFYIPVFENMPGDIKLPTNDGDKNYDNIGGNTGGESIDQSKTDATSAVVSAGYSVDGLFLSNIAIGTNVANFKANLESMGVSVTVMNRNGQVVNDGSLGTGYSITVVGSTSVTYKAVVYGDPSGDAKINALDLLKIQKYILGETKLSDADYKAGDANKDGKINALDLLKIQKYILGEGNINQ